MANKTTTKRPAVRTGFLKTQFVPKFSKDNIAGVSNTEYKSLYGKCRDTLKELELDSSCLPKKNSGVNALFFSFMSSVQKLEKYDEYQQDNRLCLVTENSYKEQFGLYRDDETEPIELVYSALIGSWYLGLNVLLTFPVGFILEDAQGRFKDPSFRLFAKKALRTIFRNNEIGNINENCSAEYLKTHFNDDFDPENEDDENYRNELLEKDSIYIEDSVSAKSLDEFMDFNEELLPKDILDYKPVKGATDFEKEFSDWLKNNLDIVFPERPFMANDMWCSMFDDLQQSVQDCGQEIMDLPQMIFYSWSNQNNDIGMFEEELNSYAESGAEYPLIQINTIIESGQSPISRAKENLERVQNHLNALYCLDDLLGRYDEIYLKEKYSKEQQ